MSSPSRSRMLLEWLLARSSDRSAEKDRAARQVRIDGANTPRPGLLHQGGRQKARRIEHVFGAQQNSPGGRIVRTIGIARAKAKIGLQNLAYNIRRLVTLERMAAA